jgi:alkylhydroperoxidase family enzyme
MEEKMAARIQNPEAQPDVTTGVQHLFKAVYAGGVPRETLELVHLRASQINGCSACVDAGVGERGPGRREHREAAHRGRTSGSSRPWC